MKESIIKPFQTIIPILTALHFYLSFQWLYKYLKQVNLEMSGVITLQDLLFHFADLNQGVIVIALSGLTFVIITKLIVSKQTYNSLNTRTIMRFKKDVKANRDFYRTIKKRSGKILYIIIIYGSFTAISSIIIYNSFKIIMDGELPSWVILFMLLFIIAPLAYIVYVPKRNTIALVSLLILLKFSNLLIDKIVKDSFTKKPENFVEMSFIYKGNQKIKTNRDTLWSFYEGYKYIILRNPKTNETFKFEPELVTNIKRKKVNFITSQASKNSFKK